LGEPGEVGEINDLLAIAADWAAIGEDFKAAFAEWVNQASERELAASVLLAIILGLAEGEGDE
jgi:negative regulator of sigma E activity